MHNKGPMCVLYFRSNASGIPGRKHQPYGEALAHKMSSVEAPELPFSVYMGLVHPRAVASSWIL